RSSSHRDRRTDDHRGTGVSVADPMSLPTAVRIRRAGPASDRGSRAASQAPGRVVGRNDGRGARRVAGNVRNVATRAAMPDGLADTLLFLPGASGNTEFW